MPTTIANLAVKLTTDAAQMITGFGRGAAAAKQFAGNVLSTGTKITGVIGAIGAAATGGGISVLVAKQMEAIDQMAKLSDRMGISTESLATLSHAADLAGVSSEELTGGLEKMLKSLADTSDEGGKSAAALQSLGLKTGDLKNAAPDQVLGKLADAVASIHDPFQRAAAVVDIFGKSGQRLEPLLLGGAAGIAAMQEKTEKLGLSFSRVDAAKVEAANDSLTEVGDVFVGIGRTLAVDVAPFITALSTKFVDAATSGEGMAARVNSAFEFVVKGLAYAADYLAVLDSGWDALRFAASYAIGGILEGLGLLISGLEWLSNKVAGTTTHFGESMQSAAKTVLSVGDDAYRKAGADMNTFLSGANSKAAASAFKDIRAAAQANAQTVADNAAAMNNAAAGADGWAAKMKTAADNAKKITDTIDDLTKQIHQLGMSDMDKKLDDAAAAGASPAQLANIKAMLDQIKRFDDAKKSADALAESIASIDKSADQAGMTETQKRLDDLKRLGASSDQLAKAKTELDRTDAAETSTKISDPKLVMANSAEAQRLRYEAMSTPGVQKFNAQKTAEKQLDASETQVDLQKQLVNLAKNPPFKIVSNF